MVDAQPAGVAEGGPDGLHERPVAGGPQPPRVERGQAPVLAPGVELVGRGADGHVEGEDVLPQPGVGAARVDPHRQVVHHRHAGRRRRLQLEVDQPLQPLVEPDPVGMGPAVGRHLGPVGVAELLRPRLPVAAVLLDQGAEGGVGVEGVALRLPPAVEVGVAGEGVPHLAEGVELEPPHRVPVDQPLPVEGPAGGGQLVEAVAEGGAGTGHVLHPQVERVAEPAAAREVGAGRLGEPGGGGVERVDQDQARAQLGGRPRGQLTEVGQVAHPPAGRRPHGVELHRPPPRGVAGGQRAPAGADDDRGHGAVVETGEDVVAEGEVGRQVVVDPDLGPVLGA